MDDVMQRLMKTLNADKRNGCDMFLKIEGVSCLFQHALKKRQWTICDYFFSIREKGTDFLGLNSGAEPHFNVRPYDNLDTGSMVGTYSHYNF